MSTRRFELTDELLRTALAARAIRADDELTANLIDAQVLDAAASMRQFRRWATFADLAFGRWTPIVVIVLLLAGLVGIVALASIFRPDRPLSQPGDILVYSFDSFDSSAPTSLVVDPETGTNVTRRYSISLPDRSWQPTWFPDGHRVIYVVNGTLRIIDASTGTVSEVGHCPQAPDNCDIALSPDGSWVALTYLNQIQRLDLDTGATTTLFVMPTALRGVGSPAISPNGEAIAFAFGRDLYRVGTHGGGLTLLATEASVACGPKSIAWSPDGEEIAYISSFQRTAAWPECVGRLAIFVIAADGSSRRLLFAGGSHGGPAWGPPGVAWSPDASALAFITRGYGEGEGEGGLFIIDREGGQPRFVRGGVVGIPAWQSLPE